MRSQWRIIFPCSAVLLFLLSALYVYAQGPIDIPNIDSIESHEELSALLKRIHNRLFELGDIKESLLAGTRPPTGDQAVTDQVFEINKEIKKLRKARDHAFNRLGIIYKKSADYLDFQKTTKKLSTDTLQELHDFHADRLTEVGNRIKPLQDSLDSRGKLLDYLGKEIEAVKALNNGVLPESEKALQLLMQEIQKEQHGDKALERALLYRQARDRARQGRTVELLHARAARTAPRLIPPDVVNSAKPLLPTPPVNVELQQLPPTQNPSQAIIRIPQRDAVNGRVFITRAEYQVLMNDWVAKVGSQKISAPKVGALRKLGGTFLQGIQYMPLPSEIINAVTGATDQDWIDVRNADIKNAKARIDVININIVDLERQRDAIPQNSVSKPIGVSMKGDNSRDNEKNRNILEKQIESLYKKRSENIDMIRLWQYHIQEKISNQINEEYNKMLNKKYVDRPFGSVY